MSIRDRIFEKSVFARSHPATTQQVIDTALELEWVEGVRPDAMRDLIVQRYEQKYGSQIWVTLAVRFIVPYVVDLFLKRLANKKNLTEQKEIDGNKK